MVPPRQPPKTLKLSDCLGQYVLTIECVCGHVRIARPQTLAKMAGWDAELMAVAKRLRCSKCGARQCSVAVRAESKRDT